MDLFVGPKGFLLFTLLTLVGVMGGGIIVLLAR